MKKKIVSVLLTCCMTFGGSVSTLAAEENHTQQDMQQDSQNVVDKSENQLVGQEQKSETDNTVTDENSQNNSVVEESVNDTANAENNAAQETVEEEQKETGPLLVYSGHVQSYGNVKAVEDGALFRQRITISIIVYTVRRLAGLAGQAMDSRQEVRDMTRE